MKEFNGGKTMMNNDIVEKYGVGSYLQHGKLNNRIYLMKLHEYDIGGIIEYMNKLAHKNKYTKLFCKIPNYAAPIFMTNGFFTEAIVPKFFKGKDAAFFMAKYLNSDRLLNIEYDKMHELSPVLKEARKKRFTPKSNVIIERLTKKDAIEIAGVYKEVFKSYPFPIHEADYIEKTMDEDVQYYGIKENNILIALSSAEVDLKGENAEMTDFATLPEHRGKKLSISLLYEMERMMREQKIKTLYTIARLNSIPMNKTFLHLGYIYSGTLINNTNIAGAIESMNVLYKPI